MLCERQIGKCCFALTRILNPSSSIECAYARIVAIPQHGVTRDAAVVPMMATLMDANHFHLQRQWQRQHERFPFSSVCFVGTCIIAGSDLQYTFRLSHSFVRSFVRCWFLYSMTAVCSTTIATPTIDHHRTLQFNGVLFLVERERETRNEGGRCCDHGHNKGRTDGATRENHTHTERNSTEDW